MHLKCMYCSETWHLFNEKKKHIDSGFWIVNETNSIQVSYLLQ